MTAWFTSYRKEWLRPDVLAGLTAAAVVILRRGCQMALDSSIDVTADRPLTA